MSIRTLPWHKFGSPPAWSGTLPGLRRYFGPSWSAVSGYFLPTPHLALSIECPKPGGDNCPRQIVKHGDNDLVAVCGNSPRECDPLPLSRQEIIIHELKIDLLLADLARVLDIRGTNPERLEPLTWNLGWYSLPSRVATSVFLCLEDDADLLRLTAAGLLHRHQVPFALLIASRRLCPASLPPLLEGQNAWLAPLDELTAAGNDADAAFFLARYLPEGAPPQVLESENSLQLKADFWHVRCLGEEHFIKHTVGMHYIAHLISRAYNDQPEIHALELFYLVNGRPPAEKTSLEGLNAEQLEEQGLAATGLGSGIEVMTPEEMAWMKEKLQGLGQEMAEAEECGDHAELLRLREEKEKTLEFIKKGYGLSGKGRTVGDTNKRVGQSVSTAMRKLLKRMEKENSTRTLAQYLDRHLSTGQFCSFRKDEEKEWKVIL